VQNPLTSLSDDIDRTSKLAAAQDGPILVGHSYCGAVITGAGHSHGGGNTVTLLTAGRLALCVLLGQRHGRKHEMFVPRQR
jgi:hypothetical protein